jgi:fermentation-respiration switch protein FrsA (DUF1100 family)
VGNVIWTNVASDTGTATTRDFLIQYDGGEVPGALWLPANAPPKALILVGHGGSRHKREITNLTFIEEAVERNGFAVAAIDGPLHGARRGDQLSKPSYIQKEFLGLWESAGNGIALMLADWQATLGVLVDELKVSELPVGYFGLSMGTAYGLPFVAADERVGAAVLGMWGANYPNSDVLVNTAGEVSCPVLFMHKSDDNFFTLEGALEIYNAIPGDDKRLLMNSGSHSEATSEQIQAALTFFIQRLETT